MREIISQHIWTWGVLVIIYVLLSTSTFLGGGADPASSASKDGAARAPALLIAPEDLRTLGGGGAAQGPVVTGSIQPARRADLRAEVSAVVLQQALADLNVAYRNFFASITGRRKGRISTGVDSISGAPTASTTCTTRKPSTSFSIPRARTTTGSSRNTPP